jgi:hypothetical protein
MPTTRTSTNQSTLINLATNPEMVVHAIEEHEDAHLDGDQLDLAKTDQHFLEVRIYALMEEMGRGMLPFMAFAAIRELSLMATEQTGTFIHHYVEKGEYDPLTFIMLSLTFVLLGTTSLNLLRANDESHLYQRKRTQITKLMDRLLGERASDETFANAHRELDATYQRVDGLADIAAAASYLKAGTATYLSYMLIKLVAFPQPLEGTNLEQLSATLLIPALLYFVSGKGLQSFRDWRVGQLKRVFTRAKLSVLADVADGKAAGLHQETTASRLRNSSQRLEDSSEEEMEADNDGNSLVDQHSPGLSKT